ncbi:MAG: beta-Ala-His dipeptidase, partial [Lachnospiraceae bacterium]|nr:beta-Ala-His dipeptidase [Lachnospiraceae bacterium]
MSEIDELLKKDYKDVLKNFVELTKIPHGSGNMKPIGDYIESRLKETKLAYVRDGSDNFIIRKEATKGYEALPVLSLQGHLDMVCEKGEGSEHDFEKDALPIRFDGVKLYCDKTTLGGDDGIAIAYCLSMMSDDTLVHPELEFIFTTDEETGLYGAKALDGSSIKGKYLINLDSEDEGTALVACAGGATSVSRFALKKDGMMNAEVLELSVAGLFGGHSGAEIDKNRENAIKVISRVLGLWKNELKDNGLDGYRLISFNGGTKDNAIPRSACVLLAINALQANNALELLKKVSQKTEAAIRPYENEVKIDFILKEEKVCEAYTAEESDKFIEYLNLAQTGVIMMDRDDPKMVETSCNLAIVREYEDGLEVHQSFRS